MPAGFTLEPRAMWCANAVVSAADERKNRERHALALRTMRPAIDSSPPHKPAKAMQTGGINAVAKERRRREVAKEDSVLREKLQKLKGRPPAPPPLLLTEPPHGTMVRLRAQKIREENEKLVKKITTVRPTYPIREYKQAHAVHTAKSRSPSGTRGSVAYAVRTTIEREEAGLQSVPMSSVRNWRPGSPRSSTGAQTPSTQHGSPTTWRAITPRRPPPSAASPRARIGGAPSSAR